MIEIFRVKTLGDILCLFIVAILLTVWSFCILITYLQAMNVSYLMAFFDFLGLIALIVAVALLSNVVENECVNIGLISRIAGTNNVAYLQYLQSNSIGQVSGANYDQYCKLIKAAWGLGIANILFFFLTAAQGAQIAQAFAKRSKRVSRTGGGGGGGRREVIEVIEPVATPVVIREEGPRRKKSKKSKRRSSRSQEFYGA